jgi:hypothetical protein
MLGIIIGEDDCKDECTFALMTGEVFKMKNSRGSRVGRSLNIPRNFDAANTILMKDYFDENCVFKD